jgi:hypothetical protein
VIHIEVDARRIIYLEGVFRQAGNQAPHAIRRALNWTGDRATTQVTRALVKQTGAKYGAVKAALKQVRASYGSLTYKIIARGSAISLKEFGARRLGPVRCVRLPSCGAVGAPGREAPEHPFD